MHPVPAVLRKDKAMKKTIMKKYANLLIKQGVNIKKGQELVIVADVEAAPFVALLTAEAYRAGASGVRVDWAMTELTKLHYRYQTRKKLCSVPEWRVEKLRHDAEVLPARIRLICEDPDGLASVNQEKLAAANAAFGKVSKKFREQTDNKYQWLVCAIPGRAWAKKVVPNERPAAALEKLWEAILSTVLCGADNDPVAEWDAKNAAFAARCEKLNAKHFDYLEYKSANGTDFRCSLMESSLWCGGGEYCENGIYFNPNMPTEEIFTTPKKGCCEGRLVAAMPLSLRGTLVEDFYIDFKDGKAVNWHAEKGGEALTKLIETDEGSRMLGELALVPKDSPIAKSGLLFYNTLFDENASCHVALGSGYTSCVKDYTEKTLAEMREEGVNDSMVHVDFMVGAQDLCITGYKDGKATPVFINGSWAPEFE